MVSTLPLIFDWTNFYVVQAWGIVAIVFFRWLGIRNDKAGIRREVIKLKAQTVAIRWRPFHRGGGMHDTFYEVTLVLPSGKCVTAECKYHPFDGIHWESTPWAEGALNEPASAPS